MDKGNSSTYIFNFFTTFSERMDHYYLLISEERK